jgi:hypothetical protein
MRNRIKALGPIGKPIRAEDAKKTSVFIVSTLEHLADAMWSSFVGQGKHTQGLRFKVPGCHFILPYLAKTFLGFKYIHVIRHGVDMAFSSNQNQLHRGDRIMALMESTNFRENPL